MRRMRRRKPRVVWLPNIGSIWCEGLGGAPVVDTGGQQAGLFFFNQVIPVYDSNGNRFVSSVPLVLDNTDQSLFAAPAAPGGLNTYQGQRLGQQQSYGYRLRRIVGTVVPFVSAVPSVAGIPKTPGCVEVACGMMIRRVDDTSVSPLGGSGLDPIGLENITDPWIWRRNWLLSPDVGSLTVTFSNTDAFATTLGTLTQMQSNPLRYTGANSNCSFDQKTARRVAAEERLFFDVGVRAIGITPNSADAFSVNLGMFLDYRVLASTFSQGGSNRRNSTR